MPESLSSLITSNLIQGFLTFFVILVLTVIALRLVNIGSKEIDQRIITLTEDPNRRARLLTVRKAAKSTLQVVIIALAVLIALGTLGIDIGPALLSMLFSHADEAYYLRHIARSTGAGLGALQRELNKLTDSGIILRMVRGKQVYIIRLMHNVRFSRN